MLQEIDGKITICGGTGPGCKAGSGCSDKSQCFYYDPINSSWNMFPEMKQARR